MEYYYTLDDPLVLAVIGLSFIISCIFIKELTFYIRRVTPKTVKCWFCQCQTKIPYESSNSWVCPQCEQYNGFNKEGDYNKHIPSQHDAKLNQYKYAQKSIKTSWHSTNKLCDKCNFKQQLKVLQLANFVPMNENNYDKEVEHFQQQLENGYELCRSCDLLVSKVLQKLREELSLPKKLTTAIAKINIRGERAIYINIVLSFLLAVSLFPWDMYKPSDLKFYLRRYLMSYQIEEVVLLVSSHQWTLAALSYSVQILIGTGILVNSVGFYQTNNAAIFFNIVSWILMFFLTLYPNGYEDLINILKVIASLISISISLLILLKNREMKNRRKPTVWEKKNFGKIQSSFSTPSHFSSRMHSPVSAYSSVNHTGSSISPTVLDDSPVSISSGISNLSLGIRKRKEIRKPTKPILTPPKFNPFMNGSKTSPSEKNYQLFGKQSPSCSYSHYDPSLTPPSVYESYENEPITTIHSYGYPQTCYPYSPPPTLAYYFSSQQYPKMLTPTDRVTPFYPEAPKKEYGYLWMLIFSLPVVFLALCNLVLLYTVYVGDKDVLRT